MARLKAAGVPFAQNKQQVISIKALTPNHQKTPTLDRDTE
jgi:hypothetical protein